MPILDVSRGLEVLRFGQSMRKITIAQVLAGSVLFLYCFWLFTYHLVANPPGFFIDESVNGFEAYTILSTGGFSSTGEFLPRLFGEPGTPRNHGTYIYFIVPFVGLLGLTEASVRLTTIFTSLALICAICLILRKSVSSWSLCLALLWWPLTSWVFLLSRIGMEFIFTAFLSIAALYLVFQILQSNGANDLYIVALGIVGTILFFAYGPGKVLTTAYILAAIIVLIRRDAPIAGIIKLALSLIVIAILALPYIIDQSFFYGADYMSQCKINQLLCFAQNAISHFNYNMYFADTFIPFDFPVVTHSITGAPLIPRPLALPLIIGLLLVLYRGLKGDLFSRILTLSFLIGIIPASLTPRGFDSYRSCSVLPVIYITIILGFDACLLRLRAMSLKTHIVAIILLLIGTGYFARQEIAVLFDYEYETAAAMKTGWHFGYRDIFTYCREHYHEYDAFLVTENIAYVPDAYIRFYDPHGVYSKIRIGSVSTDVGRARRLYILRPEEIDLDRLDVKHTIYYPNGVEVAFYLGELK